MSHENSHATADIPHIICALLLIFNAAASSEREAYSWRKALVPVLLAHCAYQLFIASLKLVCMDDAKLAP